MFKIDEEDENTFTLDSEELINMRPQRSPSIPIYNDCQNAIKKAVRKLSAIEHLKNNPEQSIHEHLNDIGRRVNLRREALKQEIDSCADKIIENIDTANVECLKINHSIEDITKYIEHSTHEIHAQNTLEIDESTLNSIAKELAHLEIKLQELIKYKEAILSIKEFSFEFNPDTLDISNLFGKLVNLKRNTIRALSVVNDTNECQMKPMKSEWVCSVAFNRGRLLATGSMDNTVKIWNTETGSLVRTLEGHSRNIHSCVFNDENLLATVSFDYSIKVWNTDTWDVLQTLEGHSNYVYSIAFGLNNMLASGSADNTVQIWDIKAGVRLRTLQGHTNAVTSVAFNRQNLLASGSWDNTVRVWNCELGKLVRTLKGHSHTVTCVSFNQLGNLLASGSWDSTVRLWSTESWQLVRTLVGHANWIYSVAFGKGDLLATASFDSTAKLWNSGSGALVETLAGHVSTVTCVAFKRDGLLLATGSLDNTIKLWETCTWTLLRTLKHK